MTTNLQLQEMVAATTYGAINHAIRSLDVSDLEQMTAIGDTFVGQLQRLTKVYTAVKPLMAAFSALPLLPQSWRAALALFVATLDAITSAPEANPDFKAGKDL